MAEPKNLVIVESPAKARTIGPYLGGDFNVLSSFGHIRDLPKKGLGVDIANNFEPSYEVSEDKKKVVSELKKQAKGKTVWLATDDDREGEAIAWHLCFVLGLDPKKTHRIVFHEITKQAILAALEHPRTVDEHLVDAQQARRVLDRLVGYKLSPVLWKKVQAGLSAGRVQSVAVRLITEREREIRAFNAQTSYKLSGIFDGVGAEFDAELDKKLADDIVAKKFLNDCIGASYKVGSVTQKPATRNSAAPFTTSTLQQEAARRLGFSVKQTMTIAQRLYENGFITYMRTDSTTLSNLALEAAQKYINSTYGERYLATRQFKTKNSSAQEAHEAIRPTDFNNTSAGDDPNQKRLYQLIWQRALSSQMAPAKIQKTEVVIDISTRSEKFLGKGEVLEFDGFMKVYGGGKDDVILPKLEAGKNLVPSIITATQIYSRAPARYGEASLVKKLEEMGIGRPSTYAPTISTVQDRGYIEKKDLDGQDRSVHSLTLKNGSIEEQTQSVVTGADRAKLLPTYLAEMTTDFLTKHFAEIVDYDFTAKAEVEFDKVADGKRKWPLMIKNFYQRLEPLIEKSDDISRSETSQATELGIDPKSQKPVIARYGRYGPMLQIGDQVEGSEEKPRFASLPANTTIDTVTLEQALKMFDLPRVVGKTIDGEEILSNIGRFGPYIKIGKTFVSIKGHDPLTISEQESRQLYLDKQANSSKNVIQDFGKIKIIEGPYGPYATDGKKNAKILKTVDATKLTEVEAAELIEKAPKKGRRSFRSKKKTT